MAYCIRAPGYTPPSPSPTDSPTPPAPTHSGEPPNCNKWHVVEDGDTCETVPAKYGITKKQFLAWNPAVSSDCTENFWLGQAYCVGVSSSTTEPPTPTTTSDGPQVPTPTQPGNAVSACNDYGEAQDGDTCGIFADRHDISLQQLYTWNKLLKEDGSGCANSFWAGYWYCIGVMVKSQKKPVIQL